MRLSSLLKLIAFLVVFWIDPAVGIAQVGPQPIGTIEPPADKNEAPAAPLKPKPEQERPTRWGEPTDVRVGIYVIDVDGVDSANQRFSASVYYSASWNNPLLRHKGPGPIIRRLTDVWSPRLVIINQQQAWSSFPAFVEISPDGEVNYRQKTWGWFSESMKLQDFPLDQQTLTIHIVAAGMLESDVKMIPAVIKGGRASGIAKNFSMPDFKVVDWSAGPRPYVAFEGLEGTAGFIMKMNVERLPSYYIWKVIFPICLIVIMSWIPRWLDPKEIGTSIGISTTAFLTLVAYLFAIVNLLPRVSYLTRMDLFILMSMALVFVALLQTTVGAYFVNRDITARVEATNRVSRFIYPILLFAVLVASFV